MSEIETQKQREVFLKLVAGRLREYGEGESGRVLAAVLPDQYERMAVVFQQLVLGALAVVQEWDRDDNPGGEVGFTNIGAVKAGLREVGVLSRRPMTAAVPPVWWDGLSKPSEESQGPPAPGSFLARWGRGKGCEKP